MSLDKIHVEDVSASALIKKERTNFASKNCNLNDFLDSSDDSDSDDASSASSSSATTPINVVSDSIQNETEIIDSKNISNKKSKTKITKLIMLCCESTLPHLLIQRFLKKFFWM